MTVYKGLLLFDIAETSIGRWENELGWRGMREVWRNGDYTLNIDVDEDSEREDQWELWLANDKTGYWESIGWGTFDEVDKMAKEYMRDNPFKA
jgi:hypothetical protein